MAVYSCPPLSSIDRFSEKQKENRLHSQIWILDKEGYFFSVSMFNTRILANLKLKFNWVSGILSDNPTLVAKGWGFITTLLNQSVSGRSVRIMVRHFSVEEENFWKNTTNIPQSARLPAAGGMRSLVLMDELRQHTSFHLPRNKSSRRYARCLHR